MSGGKREARNVRKPKSGINGDRADTDEVSFLRHFLGTASPKTKTQYANTNHNHNDDYHPDEHGPIDLPFLLLKPIRASR